jgi:hypothetical protein
MDLSILSVIKNEGHCLAKWIELHLLVGVETFYLVINDNGDNISAILAPYVPSGYVMLSSGNSKRQEEIMYTEGVLQLRNSTS